MNRTQDTILSEFRSFFGRSYGLTILFQDLLTFSIIEYDLNSDLKCPLFFQCVKQVFDYTYEVESIKKISQKREAIMLY